MSASQQTRTVGKYERATWTEREISCIYDRSVCVRVRMYESLLFGGGGGGGGGGATVTVSQKSKTRRCGLLRSLCGPVEVLPVCA
jgi:hypothetical protein